MPYPSPEDEYLEEEKRQEFHHFLAKKLFQDQILLDIWIARNVYSSSIRNMAMRFQMSRYNIREKLKQADQRINEIRVRVGLFL